MDAGDIKEKLVIVTHNTIMADVVNLVYQSIEKRKSDGTNCGQAAYLNRI
jgi:hypothetical protein